MLLQSNTISHWLATNLESAPLSILKIIAHYIADIKVKYISELHQKDLQT